MSPKHAKYDFPSGEPVDFDLSQIEGPLRRQKKERDIPTWVLLVLICLVAALGYFVVAKTVETQKVQAQELREASRAQWASFCERAELDHALVGTQAGEELNKLCN